jgi:glutamate racemase
MAEVGLVRKTISGPIAKKINAITDKPLVTESSPIGMFDSGVGGLTVLDEVIKLMPKESIIYLADTARVPYGGRSPIEIIKINNEIIPYLIGQGAKMIIMACGTSSAIAFPVVKDKYNIPIIGMIEGGARMAASATKNKKIGIIATAGTINSHAYDEAIKKIDKDISVYPMACPLLVPLIEGGFALSEETTKVLKEYLKPLNKAKIDTLILGCTHYPILSGKIKDITGPSVGLINPAVEIANSARDALNKYGLASLGKEPPKYRYITTGPSNSFRDIGSRLLGRPLANVEEIRIVKGTRGR